MHAVALKGIDEIIIDSAVAARADDPQARAAVLQIIEYMKVYIFVGILKNDLVHVHCLWKTCSKKILHNIVHVY